MTTAPPLTAEGFVARLLATDDENKRRAFYTECSMQSDIGRDAVRLLIDEAERLVSINPRHMERVCLDALALADAIDDHYWRAMARLMHGQSCILQERNLEGRTYLDEAREQFNRLNCPVEVGRTYVLSIWAAANLGLDSEARAAGHLARRIFIAHAAQLHLGTLDMALGVFHCMRSRFRAGLGHLRSAVAIYESLDQPIRAARARHNLGNALNHLDRYREALSELEGARAIAGRSGQTTEYAVYSNSLGEAQMSLGRYAAALRTFEEISPIFQTFGLDFGAVRLARDMADCYLRLNRPADALTILESVDDQLRRVDRKADASAHAMRRVAAYLLLDERDAALSTLDAMSANGLATDLHEQAWVASQRAVVLLRSRALDDALTSIRIATALARKSGPRRRVADVSLIESSILLEVGNIDEAERSARRARRVARTLDAAPLLHRSFEQLGRIAEARNQRDAARRRYAAAIRQVEREQRGVIFEFRAGFAAARGFAYERLASLQFDAAHLPDALRTAERAKSRALADAIAGTVEPRPRGTATARRLANELTAAREEYSATLSAIIAREDSNRPPQPDDDERTHRLKAIEGQINSLIQRLQLTGATDTLTEPYDATSGASLPNMAVDAALVEFFISGADILRFHVDADGVHGERLAGAVPRVEHLLRTFRLNIEATVRATPDDRKPLSNHARTILARLNQQLLSGLNLAKGCRTLVIVPHGLLHYLPFHALHDGQRYLIEQYAVTYAPSITIYDICRSRRARGRRRKSVVLAHSTGNTLPHIEEEASAISEVLHATVYRGRDAKRSLLESEANAAGIIHIAAHGVFRPEAPMFSYIQLADGPVTAADVFQLKLQAALVTLSACDTGRAVLGGGDELIGLSRAFLYAGAAGLVVSQWRVDDRSTAALMARLYREFSQYRAAEGPANALQAAQLAHIRSDSMQAGTWEHPYFWAGFQAIGAD
ncbi:MAG: CHAT domain-containing protein [Dehalococcoidia bacterium]